MTWVIWAGKIEVNASGNYKVTVTFRDSQCRSQGKNTGQITNPLQAPIWFLMSQLGVLLCAYFSLLKMSFHYARKNGVIKK